MVTDHADTCQTISLKSWIGSLSGTLPDDEGLDVDDEEARAWHGAMPEMFASASEAWAELIDLRATGIAPTLH